MSTTFFLVACAKDNGSIKKEIWGQIENSDIYLYTITNTNGMTIKVTNYGGIITSILVPDKHGKIDNVVLGFDNLKQYQEPNPSLGAVIGRFANRIENATFQIDNINYQLTKNIGDDVLHGNNEFECAIWDSKTISNEIGNGIQLHYISKDGTNGFPGNIDVYITYTLSNTNKLHVTFEATTDKSTHLNLTQHSYFNLSGTDAFIYNHLVKIDAKQYIKYNNIVKPSRTLASLKNHNLDLSTYTRLGDRIHNIPPNGYNHCYVLNKPLNTLKQVAEVIEPNSGRTLSVSTTQPGLVFYTSNYLNTDLAGNSGVQYPQHAGLCLETQHYPDTPNNSNFPSTLLKPGEQYEEVVIYSFGVIQQ